MKVLFEHSSSAITLSQNHGRNSWHQYSVHVNHECRAVKYWCQWSHTPQGRAELWREFPMHAKAARTNWISAPHSLFSLSLEVEQQRKLRPREETSSSDGFISLTCSLNHRQWSHHRKMEETDRRDSRPLSSELLFILLFLHRGSPHYYEMYSL